MLFKSNCVTIVNASKDFFSNLGELKEKLHQKYPDRTIVKGRLFAVSTNNSTFISVKSSIAAEEEVAFDFAFKFKAKVKLEYSPMLSCIKEALL